MACIYVIYSKTRKKTYTGSSHDDNPSDRLKSHNYGKTRSTKNGKPWMIIHIENFDNYTEARKRELFLKSGVGRKWIKENININLERWQSG